MGTTKDIRDAVDSDVSVVSAAWMAGGVMQVRDDLDIIG